MLSSEDGMEDCSHSQTINESHGNIKKQGMVYLKEMVNISKEMISQLQNQSKIGALSGGIGQQLSLSPLQSLFKEKGVKLSSILFALEQEESGSACQTVDFMHTGRNGVANDVISANEDPENDVSMKDQSSNLKQSDSLDSRIQQLERELFNKDQDIKSLIYQFSSMKQDLIAMRSSSRQTFGGSLLPNAQITVNSSGSTNDTPHTSTSQSTLNLTPNIIFPTPSPSQSPLVNPGDSAIPNTSSTTISYSPSSLGVANTIPNPSSVTK